MQRVVYTTAPNSKPGLTLPNGHLITSISIDNPSGSWLALSTSKELVPPYVLGWVRNLPWGAASLDVTFVAGPTGLLSTTQTDTVQITLADENDPLGADSNGTPYIGSNQPPSLRALNFLLGYNTAQTLLVCPAGLRIRLYALFILPNESNDNGNVGVNYPPLSFDIQLGFGAGTAVGPTLIYSGIAGRIPIPVPFTLGLDGPVGANLNGRYGELWTIGGQGLVPPVVVPPQPSLLVYQAFI